MSDFNTWEEIQEWMIFRYDDYEYDHNLVDMKFPHPTVENMYIRATLIDEWARGYFLRLYIDDIVCVGHGDDEDAIELFYPSEYVVKGLKAFCPDPTTVTVIKDDGYDD